RSTEAAARPLKGMEAATRDGERGCRQPRGRSSSHSLSNDTSDDEITYEGDFAMTRTVFTAGALALVIAAGTGAMGYGMPGGGGGHGGFLGGPRMLHALGLSAEQKQQVRAVFQAHAPTFKQLAANERTAREAIADAMFGTGTVTQPALDALVQ